MRSTRPTIGAGLGTTALLILAACRDESPSTNPFVPTPVASVARPAACPACVVGPQLFPGNTNAVLVFSGSPAGSHVVRVERSGSPTATASVWLNGTIVVGPPDLAGSNALVTRSVQVRSGFNSLSVRVLGGSGTAVSVSVLGGVNVIDQSGGSVTSLDGKITVTVPAGALGGSAEIGVSPLTQSTIESRIGRPWSPQIRFLGGVAIDAGTAVFNKPALVKMENALGAQPGDQILVGRIDPARPAPANFVYQGAAQLGSISFAAPQPGSFGTVSSTVPLTLATGHVRDPSGQPIAGATVTSTAQIRLSAVTDAKGQFTIPVGPSGTYALLGGLPSQTVTCLLNGPAPCKGAALLGFPIPPILPGTSFPISDWIIDRLADAVDIRQPDLSGPCPPPPIANIEMSERPPFPSGYGFSIPETIHVYVRAGVFGIYGTNITDKNAVVGAAGVLGLKLLDLILLGSIDIFESTQFHLADPTVARFAFPTTSDGATSDRGTILGMSAGTTRLTGLVNVTQFVVSTPSLAPKFCPYEHKAFTQITGFHIATAGQLLPDATAGTPYLSTQLATNVGAGPVIFAADPATPLPPGLIITPGSTQISGTPTMAGTYTFRITALDRSTPVALRAVKSFDLIVGPAAVGRVLATHQANCASVTLGVHNLPWTNYQAPSRCTNYTDTDIVEETFAVGPIAGGGSSGADSYSASAAGDLLIRATRDADGAIRSISVSVHSEATAVSTGAWGGMGKASILVGLTVVDQPVNYTVTIECEADAAAPIGSGSFALGVGTLWSHTPYTLHQLHCDLPITKNKYKRTRSWSGTLAVGQFTLDVDSWTRVTAYSTPGQGSTWAVTRATLSFP